MNDDHFRISLISPWMENGSINRYQCLHPGFNCYLLVSDNTVDMQYIDQRGQVYDIAKGLEFLHSLGIIHGDLKGVTLLLV